MASASSCAVTEEAHLSSHGGSEDEEMETRDNQDATPPSEEDATATAPWILVARRAKCRRDQRLLTSQQQLAQTPEKPALCKSRPAARRPRQPPLPAEDLKLAFRPRNGLRLARVSPEKLLMAIATEVKMPVGAVNIKMRVDGVQNVLVASTPCETTAMKLSEVKKLTIDGNSYEVASYAPSPDNSCKGVIHNIDLDTTPDTVLKRIEDPSYEVLTCRRLGNTETMVITFCGKRVPYYVNYSGIPVRCYLYKRTVPYCRKCNETGHREDVCPQPPKTPRCGKCGLSLTADPHDCHPQCILCGGTHPTADKSCAKRYLPPVNRRKSPLRQQQSSRQARSPSPELRGGSSRFRQSRSSTRRNASQRRSISKHRSGSMMKTSSRKRTPSRGRTPSEGRSRSHSRRSTVLFKNSSGCSSQSKPSVKQQAKGEKHNQVSWASVISPAARSPSPPQQCFECNKLQAEIQTLRTEIQTLKKFMAEQTKTISTLTQSISAVTEVTSEERTPPTPSLPPPDQQPIIEKKRKIENREEDTMETNPQYVTRETLNASLGDVTAPILSQLQAIASKLNQLSAQVQNTQHRVESLETQTTPLPGRLARREKPYHRPVLNDTTTDLPINHNDH